MTNLKPLALGVRDLHAEESDDYTEGTHDVIAKFDLNGNTCYFYSEDYFDTKEEAEDFLNHVVNEPINHEFDYWSDKMCNEPRAEYMTWTNL